MIYATLDEKGFVTGFYNTDVNGDNIPETAVKITEEQYNKLLNNQGKKALVNGKVVSKEKLASEEELLESKVLKARDYLNSTDWYFIRKTETGQEVPEGVLSERDISRKIISDYQDSLS